MIRLGDLDGRRGVVIDTMVFIYLFEDDPKYAEVAERLLSRVSSGFFSAAVTPVTAAELLVKPLQAKDYGLADRYRGVIRSFPNLSHPAFDLEIGFMAGSLRARYHLPLPDMLQAAAALRHPARTLITNDRALLRVKEVDIVLLDEIAP
jgi:predicted nucleic acid-binding protein